MGFSPPKTPALSVDILITLHNNPGKIVLIERKYPPHGWALPGGFVDIGESTESAAIREAKEETSLDVTLTGLLGCYSDPNRDHRGHVVSLAYMGTAEGIPAAADDAKNLKLWDLNNLPTLAFDHGKIIQDYLLLSH